MTRDELIKLITENMQPGDLENFFNEFQASWADAANGIEDIDLFDADVLAFAELLADYLCDS
jgi:hypothetical protein